MLCFFVWLITVVWKIHFIVKRFVRHAEVLHPQAESFACPEKYVSSVHIAPCELWNISMCLKVDLFRSTWSTCVLYLGPRLLRLATTFAYVHLLIRTPTLYQAAHVSWPGNEASNIQWPCLHSSGSLWGGGKELVWGSDPCVYLFRVCHFWGCAESTCSGQPIKILWCSRMGALLKLPHQVYKCRARHRYCVEFLC